VAFFIFWLADRPTDFNLREGSGKPWFKKAVKLPARPRPILLFSALLPFANRLEHLPG